jgi:glycosyltransferase involved in cell wall biosynthesis
MEIKLSAIIMTFNEERNIERCLSSLQEVADEILVVDSGSTDRTEEICKSFGIRFLQHPFEGFIEQRNKTMELATFPHVLAVDADEALSEDLKKSIVQIKQNWTADAYTFNRLTNFCGTWIRHSGWYPDVKLRLLDKRKGKAGGTNPHDKIIMEKGSIVQHLKGDLLHYSYYSINEYFAQQNKFTTIASAEYYEKGKKTPNMASIILRSRWRFFRDYFLKLGFLDGYAGFLVCRFSAMATFIKYAKLKHLHDLQKSEKTNQVLSKPSL